jgi:Rhodopirellula transposase DDE domain
VGHYPPGTSKWNQIEHRMFSFISMNWKGEPLVSFETVVKMISAPKTKEGPRVKAILDKSRYESGMKISPQQMQELSIKTHRQNPEWTTRSLPRTGQSYRK